MKIASLCLLLSILVIGCHGRPKKKGTVKLPEGTYSLVAYLNKGRMVNAENEHSEINLDPKKQQMYLYFGCNRISGHYQSSGGQMLKPIQAVSTRMACDNLIESSILLLIPMIERYTLKGNNVFFYQKNKLLMTLVKQTSKVVSRSVETLDGNYQLLSMHDSRRPTTGDYSKTSIKIDSKNKRISCNVGCNSIGGQFISNENAIEPLKLAMTEMFCEKVDPLERQFVGNLEKINQYKIVDQKLELYQNDVLLMVLIKTDK